MSNARACCDSVRDSRSTSPRLLPGGPDAEVVARLWAGDEATFVALVDRYSPALTRLAQVFVSTRAVADEVVQETWMAVLRGIHGFQGRSRLRTWIFRILTNRAKTRGKQEARTIPFTALIPDDSDLTTVEPSRFASNGRWVDPPPSWRVDSPERLLMLSELRAVVEAAVKTLSAKQRAVITLRDLESWSAADVCNVLDITETYQRVLLHRARIRVRAVLARYLDGGRLDVDVQRADGASHRLHGGATGET